MIIFLIENKNFNIIKDSISTNLALLLTLGKFSMRTPGQSKATRGTVLTVISNDKCAHENMAEAICFYLVDHVFKLTVRTETRVCLLNRKYLAKFNILGEEP